MPDWDALRFLLAVSRAGSFAGAAKGLRVDPATVGRRITSLEEALGTKLFVRGANARLTPTEAGSQLLRSAAQTEATLAEVERLSKAEAETPSGVVRLSTMEVLATSFLAAALPKLAAAYPQLQLDLIVTPQVLDLARDVDLALRLSRPREESLVTRRAGTLELAVYRRNAPIDPSAPMPVIAYGEHFLRVEENAWIERLPNAHIALHTTSVLTTLEAIAAGVGAGIVPVALARNDPRMVRVTELPSASRDLWLVSHPDLAKSPRIKAVSDWIADIFAAL
jgi:DNA-binding transcriptional LysR family regulator